MNRRSQWRILVLCLLLSAIVAGPALSAGKQAQIVPQIAFPRELFSRATTIYVDLAITDGSLKYTAMGSIDTTQTKTITLSLAGVPRGKNYILVARASVYPSFPAEGLLVRKALCRAADLATVEVFTVTLDSVSTLIADAVETYIGNTGWSLNSADPVIASQVEAALDAIENPVSPETSKDVAIRLSTTQITGKVADVRGDSLGGITVTVEGDPDLKTETTKSVDPSDPSNGLFSLSPVPIRFKNILFEDRPASGTPRYLTAKKENLVLAAETPIDVGVISMAPNPQVIHDDIRSAAQCMVDNTSGIWLASGLVFTVMEVPQDVATVQYYSVDTESNYTQGQPDSNYECAFSCTWVARDDAKHQRRSYDAQGRVRYDAKVWQLTSLTLTNEVLLPLAPASATAVGGDRMAALNWAASSDPLIAGYRIYRNSVDNPATAQLVTETGRTVAAFTDGQPATESGPGTLEAGTYYYWVASFELPPPSGTPAIESPWCPVGAASVYDSKALVEQFMAAARAGNTTTMNDLLDDGFTGYVAGDPTVHNKAGFVPWLADTVFSAGSADLPAKLWEIQSTSKVNWTRSVSGTELNVSGVYTVGRQDAATANTRWSEDEMWRVSATTRKITYFISSNRTLYPQAPDQFECVNPGTVDLYGYAGLQWQAPPDPDSQPLKYYVLRGETPDWTQATRLPDNPNPSQIYYNDYSVASQTTYYYWVIAYDAYGASSMREENAEKYIMVGLPAEIYDLAVAFLTASELHDVNGILSAVTSGCDVFKESQGSDIEEYCRFTNFSLSSYYLRGFSKFGEAYELWYNVICDWDGVTYRLLRLYIIPTADGWRIDSILYSDPLEQ